VNRCRFLFASAVACGALLGLAACQVTSPDDSVATTRVLPRLQWSQSVDSATYASTRRIEVVVASGSDTAYHQTVDFLLHFLAIPSLPQGRVYALSLCGFGASGDSLWTGHASFTAQGDTLRLNVMVNASLAPCVFDTLNLFRTWDRDSLASGMKEVQKLTLNSSDSSYTSFAWGISGTDTNYRSTEYGTFSLSVTRRTASEHQGTIRFLPNSYNYCFGTTKNACGNSSSLVSGSDSKQVYGWTLTADSLYLDQNGQSYSYHK